MASVAHQELKAAYIGGSGEVIEPEGLSLLEPEEALEVLKANVKALYLRYFPNIDPKLIDFEGNYEEGLFVYNVEAPWEFLVVKPRKYRFKNVTVNAEGQAVNMTYGDAQESHVEVSRLTKYPEGVKLAAQALLNPESLPPETVVKFTLDDGVEEEVRLHSVEDGSQLRVQDRELMEGEYETDTRASDPISLLTNLAELRLATQAKFPEVLVISAGTPITGAPETSYINVNHPKYGNYIAGIEFYLLMKKFGPRTQFLVEAMNQVAIAHGFENFEDMHEKTGARLMWPASARHISLGLIHDEEARADVDHAVNLSKVLSSELAVIAEIFSASGPFMWGMAPEMEYKGQKRKVRDFRHIFRKMMSTTDYPSYPVQSPEQLAIDTAYNMRNTDRLDRAHLTKIDETRNTSETENFIPGKPTEHGMNRGRYTHAWEIVDGEIVFSKKQEGRDEYTGASASYMRAGVVSACVLNYLSSIAILATAEGMDVFDYIEQQTGIPANDLWGYGGVTEETVTEYMFEGTASPRLQVLLNKLTEIFEIIDIPGNAVQKEIALAAFKNMRETSASLQELAVTGKGTLGETLLNYANKPGLDVAKLVHVYEYCEAKFVEAIKDRPDLMLKYLKDELGFYFDENWALDPTNLEQIEIRLVENERLVAVEA